jgi:hypothetical protein
VLVRLVYASRASGEIDGPLLEAILGCSRVQNFAHGITGILCVYPKGGVFLQALEGARSEVNELYANLLRDQRHRDVTLLSFEEIGERCFSAWQMGVVDLEKINPSTILRFSEKLELDPSSLTGRSALALLEELAGTASVVSRERGRHTQRPD